MNEFAASNGRKIEKQPQGGVLLSSMFLTPVEVDALCEYFQHKRDEELGRWRWPENPDYVVKHDPLGVRIARILHEPSFATCVVRPADEIVGLGSKRDIEFLSAARSYFANHPEPKPWHYAKPEEVWLMGSGLHEFVAIVGTDGKFRFADGSDLDATEGFITGRRIWPEGDAS
ncbi:hypothetical protein [Microbacterium sp. LWH11-1.2]|uniref:hypothetical protein n=1 Tax=Microbacterium sp. LWH11-1.2 TaxID=3135258 RepID=UPI003139AADE